MPTIEIDDFRFRFYSSDLGEPPHFHVLRGDAEAKVWLEPVRLAHSHGYSERDVLLH